MKVKLIEMFISFYWLYLFLHATSLLFPPFNVICIHILCVISVFATSYLRLIHRDLCCLKDEMRWEEVRYQEKRVYDRNPRKDVGLLRVNL